MERKVLAVACMVCIFASSIGWITTGRYLRQPEVDEYLGRIADLDAEVAELEAELLLAQEDISALNATVSSLEAANTALLFNLTGAFDQIVALQKSLNKYGG